MSEKPEGYIFGRPTKYRPEYCEQLIEWMREGRSFYSFAATIPCSFETICAWARINKDFSEAKSIGKSLELKWWDDLHRRCAATGDGNATMIVWAQKNKFPKIYKERQAKGDINHKLSVTGQLNYKQLIANMKPEELVEIVKAIAEKTEAIEAEHGNNTKET